MDPVSFPASVTAKADQRPSGSLSVSPVGRTIVQSSVERCTTASC